MPVALITGAYVGLGAAFARALAAEGSDLVLVARDEARLVTTKVALEERYGITAEVLPANLTTVEGCAAVMARISQSDKPVTTLINNAGMGLYKQFGDAALTDEEQLLELNVKAVLRLSYAAVEAMPSRGGGLILNVSSVAGFVPRGAVASYSASKAWVTMFTEALAVQHANTNLKVAVVCPGYTHTEFHERAGADMSYVPSWMWQNADEVVNEALAKARGSNPIIIPGHVYRVIIALARVLPRPLVRMAMGATNARGNKQNKQKGKAQS